MHERLRRQLRRAGLDPDALPPDLSRLTAAITVTYERADREGDGQRAAELSALNQTLQREVTVRRLAEQAIRRSEARFRSLFEDLRDAIYISTPTGGLIDINPAGVALFGYASKEEMEELDLTRTLFAVPEEQRRFMAELEEKGYVQDVELRLRKKDGTRTDVLATATAVRDGDGVLTAYRAILRDVTVQRRLEKRLQRSQRMEAVGRLAGGVAHDFNNLLTAILGYGDLLLRDLPPGGPLRQRADEIRLAAERGARLTRQLLALSRRQVLRKRVLDLNALIQEMEHLLRRLIGEDVLLRTRLARDLVSIRADRSQVEQVILNLAVNARDAMPQGGVLTIRTSNVEVSDDDSPPSLGLRSGPYALLEVCDDGSGIDPSIREKIFEPFFSSKESGGGTGLGLATVYGIVEQSGGSIDLSTRVGEGTTFRIYLPGTRDAVTSELEDSTPAGRDVRGSETILLAEDEPAVRMLIAQHLGDHGYTVISATSGEDALHQADRHVGPVDLILTDMIMTGMTGVELAREVRKQRPSTRVLLISGYAEAPDARAARQAGGAGWAFLQKPFATDLLARRVRMLLDQSLPTPTTTSAGH